MKKINFLLYFILLFPIINNAQSLQTLDSIKAPNFYENIHVIKIASDSLTSSFIVFIKKEVKNHKHVFHTEHIYVLEGEGDLKLNNEIMHIKKGDIIFIPKNSPHSVIVTSTSALKVLSIQAPFFDGTDRVFID